ncbi:MAG: S1/P1 nuclease [Acidobacteria bacterium]|nr:S1/P1 nuclease [Acidobacteriota bacterium]
MKPWTRSLIPAALTAATISALSIGVGAFGEAGHRVVGTLAELHLKNTRALAEVRRILRPNETLAAAAVWPDTIKDALYEDGETALFRLNHPAHDTYHYANLPFQSERYGLDVPGARPADVVQMARECIRVLRKGKGLFTQREALRLLVHFTGDMHQPLHVGNAFVSAGAPLQFIVPQGPTGWRTTLGGNSLVYGPENRFNMHSYWDSHAVNITMQQDDVAAFAARLMTAVTVRPEWTAQGDVDGWPGQWATEGLARAKVIHQGLTVISYLGPDDAKRTAHRWLIAQPPGYDEMARPIVRDQLAAGGYRLAAVLRAIWP